MKIVFVENRHKTFFWEKIAGLLTEQSHDIHWIIQNKMYRPSLGNLHLLGYPSNANFLPVSKLPHFLKKIATSDRLANHFGVTNFNHYIYYLNGIERIIDRVKPDVIFGEATQFFELILIEVCKKRNILYLNPSSSRYPQNRFCFYKYDTLEPFEGSKEILNDDYQLRSLIADISQYRSKPDYIGLKKPNQVTKVVDKVKNSIGYLLGEKFCTPSPYKKIVMEKKTKSLQKRWNEVSENFSEIRGFKVLYALQMQPEANIDVWGNNYRDQTLLLKKIATEIKGATLLVKPNPKSKYELNEDLLKLPEQYPNLKLLHHKVKMPDIIHNIDLVITVTGTIAIERILMNKPVVTLVKTINNQVKNCLFLQEIKDITKIISIVKAKEYPELTIEQKSKFINLLMKTSYKGLISDPFIDSRSVTEKNISNITKAFNDVLAKV